MLFATEHMKLFSALLLWASVVIDWQQFSSVSGRGLFQRRTCLQIRDLTL